ncbi:hypothetical protein [Costertonia aggregata]|uniref:Uncharacterized protein n=1 Tax=Costertonia aggregata TaxID=343403 RepID=A0A7H9ARJ1_9FLAO|nr:hypothetical protein [Costertonia aggregata]QLG46036.1 hypothetical protein HYG79_12005 [Costertonia aggregata]
MLKNRLMVTANMRYAFLKKNERIGKYLNSRLSDVEIMQLAKCSQKDLDTWRKYSFKTIDNVDGSVIYAIQTEMEIYLRLLKEEGINETAVVLDKNGKHLNTSIVAQAKYALGITLTPPKNNLSCTREYWKRTVERVAELEMPYSTKEEITKALNMYGKVHNTN